MGCNCGGKKAAKAAKVVEPKTNGAWAVDWPDGHTSYYDVRVAGQADIFRAGYTLEQIQVRRNK